MKPIALALLVLALPGQVPREPAKDLSMHFLNAPGIEVRFVDYHWQPALFDAWRRGRPVCPRPGGTGWWRASPSTSGCCGSGARSGGGARIPVARASVP